MSKIFCIGIRRKYVGKNVFENDADAGNFCTERFNSLEAATQFVSESKNTLNFLKQGSHSPRNPLYIRWSEFKIEFYQTETEYAWHRLDYRKYGRCVYQMNFRTKFYTR